MLAGYGEPSDVISLSLTANYAPSWGVWEGVRETVQNWHDGLLEVANGFSVQFVPDGENSFKVQSDAGDLGHLRYDASNRKLVLANRKVQLGRQVLLLGFSKKAARSDVIGCFGEGLKVGTLALLRRGLTVTLATKEELWDFNLSIDPHFGEKVLSVGVHTRPDAISIAVNHELPNIEDALQDLDFSDTATIVQGLRQEEWEKFARRFLFLHPPKEMVATEQGRLLLDEEFAQQFFVRGVWINEDTSLAAGVDFADLKLDRDRAAVLKHSEIEHQMSSMWARATELNPSLLPSYFAVLASDKKTSDVAFADTYCDETVAASIAAYFVQQHGDTIPILSRDATSANMSRMRSELQRAALVCNQHLIAVLRKGGLQCDLDVLFKEAACRSKLYIESAALTQEEVALIAHSCALASAADPTQSIVPSKVDVFEMKGSTSLEQIVLPAEAFPTTGRYEVNRSALNPSSLHELMGGCLTPSLGSSCRCCEGELARAFGELASGSGNSDRKVQRRLVAHLAAEVCGGAMPYCATAAEVCKATPMAEAREKELRNQIDALEETLQVERDAHSSAIADLNSQVKEATKEINQHEFKIMDIHDSVRKELGAELEKWKVAAHSAQNSQEKLNKAIADLNERQSALCKRTQEVQWLQQRCRDFEQKLSGREDAIERMGETASQRESTLRKALVRRAEMLQTLMLPEGHEGTQADDDRAMALRKVREMIEEERGTVCCVCTDAPPKVVLLPCRHQHLCMQCAEALHECPICRVQIRERLEVFA